MWIIQFSKNHLISLLFPATCALCNKKGKNICTSCISSLKRTVETPTPSTYSYFSYKDTQVRNLLQKIKYFRKLYLIEPLILHISQDIFLKNFLEDDIDSILVPIPMSRKRIWRRGGNHTIYIAEAFSSHMNIPVHTTLLSRKKDTIQQVLTHSKKERLRNMRNAFTVNEKYIEGLHNKKIILIDDVTTTGATISEAKQTLEKFGFKNIKAITLAH